MIVVIWIDWYAYHNARFRALVEHPRLRGKVTGIEMVGGVGVHQGLKFRETRSADLPVLTLAPEQGWQEAGQWRLARLLWKRLNELNPSTVLVPGYYTLPGLAAAIWAKVHRRRTVLMTESTEQDHLRSTWKEKLKTLLLRSLFDWAVAGGAPHVRYLERLGFPKDRIGRFYDVVDNAFFARETSHIRATKIPQDFGLPQEYFLYVGRLSPEKNIDGLIRSFARYRRGGGTWSLVLAGDGPQADELRELAAAEGVSEAVKFAGLQPSTALPNFYAFAGSFVLPSTREPWGLVVNEAMAASLPVIVSSRCGCAEDLVKDGVNGFVFDPSQLGILARCLEQMSAVSPAARERMAAASFERISHYSPREWAAEIARITCNKGAWNKDAWNKDAPVEGAQTAIEEGAR